MKTVSPHEPQQPATIRVKLKDARNATSTSVLWLGVIAGSLCSLVVVLNWMSGAAVHHGSRGLVESLVSTIVVLWFTIDSEIRLRTRLLHKHK